MTNTKNKGETQPPQLQRDSTMSSKSLNEILASLVEDADVSRKRKSRDGDLLPDLIKTVLGPCRQRRRTGYQNRQEKTDKKTGESEKASCLPKTDAEDRKQESNNVEDDRWIKLLKQRKERVLEEMSKIEAQRRETMAKLADVWGVYKHGLEKISRLNDLRDAPDAILPGNF